MLRLVQASGGKYDRCHGDRCGSRDASKHWIGRAVNAVQGGVAERLMAAVLKTALRFVGAWVRIPPPPPVRRRGCWLARHTGSPADPEARMAATLTQEVVSSMAAGQFMIGEERRRCEGSRVSSQSPS